MKLTIVPEDCHRTWTVCAWWLCGLQQNVKVFLREP